MRPSNAFRLVQAAQPLFDHPGDPEAMKGYLADPRNLFWLASEDGVPVGFLRATSLRQPHTRRLQMFLYEIEVAPGHRQRGVGRALVERMLTHCRRHGFEEAFVLTDPGNRAAVKLYRGTGAVTETPADRMFVYRFRTGVRRSSRRA
jgi:ribosomal protein S18 acetylase RimI-like enzyme